MPYSTPRLLFWDCETTGLDCKRHGLLTTSLWVLDESLEVVDCITLPIHLEPQHCEVNEDAMRINGIDIEKHNSDPDTWLPGQAAEEIEQMLIDCSHNFQCDDPKVKPFRAAGSNPGFDRGFLTERLPKLNLNKFVSHRMIDIASIAGGKQYAGELPMDLSCGLESLAGHYGIDYKAHDAAEDVRASIEVFKRLIGKVV